MTSSPAHSPMLRGLAIVIALVGMRPASPADEGTLLDETGSGVVQVNAEMFLRVRGVEGELDIQTGAKGEVQFRSTSLVREDEDVPVAIWTDGEAFLVEPPKDHTTVRMRLRVSIPPGMGVRLDLENVSVTTAGIDGTLAVHGRQIRFDATALSQPAEFDLEGGTVSVRSAAKRVTIGGRDTDVALDNVYGQTEVRLTGGTARLSGLLGGLRGDFTSSSVAIDTVAASADLRFTKGKAAITGLRAGGEIRLSGCPLRLQQAGGEVSITSDSEVQFSDCKGSLKVDNSGGAVTGMTSTGLFDIKTQDAKVGLTDIKGELRIAGDALDVKLEKIGAAVRVSTRSSSVSIDGVLANVTIENDDGDVTVRSARGDVDLKTKHGNVHLLETHGPVAVEADGPQVEVNWAELSFAKDSRIKNHGGDVTVRFPASGGCRVEAATRNGRIDSNLPKLKLFDEGGSAQGFAGNVAQDPKTVFVEASGDVHLVGAAVPEPSGQEP